MCALETPGLGHRWSVLAPVAGASGTGRRLGPQPSSTNHKYTTALCSRFFTLCARAHVRALCVCVCVCGRGWGMACIMACPARLKPLDDRRVPLAEQAAVLVQLGRALQLRVQLLQRHAQLLLALVALAHEPARVRSVAAWRVAAPKRGRAACRFCRGLSQCDERPTRDAMCDAALRRAARPHTTVGDRRRRG
jgi:hypothetical protein